MPGMRKISLPALSFPEKESGYTLIAVIAGFSRGLKLYSEILRLFSGKGMRLFLNLPGNIRQGS